MEGAVRAGLVGQEAVLKNIKSMVRTGRVPHALIVLSPEGSGKAAIAEYLVSALFCRGKEPPCGECENCRRILHGNHPDVDRIVKSSNRASLTVQNAESIREILSVKPFEGGNRAVIVENAHTLVPAAQNKLLKTLEEPPDHAYIILMCDTTSTLLPTVLSRCAVLRPARLPFEQVKAYLMSKPSAEEDKAHTAAMLSEGWSARAEQLYEDETFWKLRRDSLEALSALAEPGGTIRCMNLIQPWKSEWKRVIPLWESYLRDCLVGGDEARIHRSERKTLEKIRNGMSRESLLTSARILARAETEMSQNVNITLAVDALVNQIAAGFDR